MTAGPDHDEHLGEWASALLDGELEPGQARAARAHVARCPVCRAELEDLQRVRAALRQLPPVHPPPGVLASTGVAASTVDLGAAARRAVTAAAVAVLLAAVSGGAERPLGLTGHRLAQMAWVHQAALAGGAVPDVGGGGLASAGVTLDGPEGALSVAHGTPSLSLFRFPAEVSWSSLPAQGRTLSIGDLRAWQMHIGSTTVVVLSGDGHTRAAVGLAPMEEAVAAAARLPAPPAPSAWTRLQAAARAALDDFSLVGAG